MPRMPRVAVYLPNLNGGGAERLHVNLAAFFLEQGVPLTIILDRAEGDLLASLPAGVEVVNLNSRALLSLPRLAMYLARNAPDILVANMVHNNLVALWARFLVGSSTKVIISVHNSLADDCRRPQLKYRIMPALYRIFAGWADGVIAVSKGIGEELSRITRVDAARIRVIYNGVVTADFQQRASADVIHPSFQKGTPVFVAVGRLHKQKDYPTLLRAFAQVLRQRQAELVILGEGDERDELQALATELGIAAHVDFAGFCANPLPLMRQASAVVMSSKFEGFGNVLAEALACGTSVVSTDCPYGPGEILANGRFGLLTPVGEPGALAEAMLRILDAPFDPDLLQGRAKAFEIARCGSHYIDFFEAVLRREEVRVVGTA